MDNSWEFVLSALLLIFIVRNYKAVVYYLKFNYFYGAMMATVTLMIPYYLLKPRNVMNLIVSCTNLKHISKVIGIKWTLRGAENLTSDKTCVFVANHQTSLDVQGMVDVWPVIKKMTVIAKRELLFAGSFGIAMFLAGLTFINRKAGGQAGHEMNEIVEDLKRKRVKLWVFPEGTRRNTGEIHPFKKGAFHAAIQAQVPIVPVVFSSYKHFLDTDAKIFDSGEVIISALPEISTEGLTADDVDDLIEQTSILMTKKYKETSKETRERMLDVSDE